MTRVAIQYLKFTRIPDVYMYSTNYCDKQFTQFAFRLLKRLKRFNVKLKMFNLITLKIK